MLFDLVVFAIFHPQFDLLTTGLLQVRAARPRKQQSCLIPPRSRRRAAPTKLLKKRSEFVAQTQPRLYISLQDHTRAMLRVGSQQSAQHRHLALPEVIAISHRSPQIDSVVYPYVVGVERCVSEHNLPQK